MIKEKFRKIASALTVTLVAATALTACNNGDDESFGGGGEGRNFALVTYTGNVQLDHAEGGSTIYSTFAYYGEDNTIASCRTSPETRLQGDLYETGQRMVIGYTLTGENYTPYPSGTINLMSHIPVPTINIENVSHEKAVETNAEMTLYYEQGKPSINRTGNYINLEIYMRHYPEREYVFVADETTLDNEMPDLYISTIEKGNPDGIKAVKMASFDMTSVWRNPSIKGVRVHINNSGGNGQKIFEFLK